MAEEVDGEGGGTETTTEKQGETEEEGKKGEKRNLGRDGLQTDKFTHGARREGNVHQNAMELRTRWAMESMTITQRHTSTLRMCPSTAMYRINTVA